jgi:hypothetical protein
MLVFPVALRSNRDNNFFCVCTSTSALRRGTHQSVFLGVEQVNSVFEYFNYSLDKSESDKGTRNNLIFEPETP